MNELEILKIVLSLFGHIVAFVFIVLFNWAAYRAQHLCRVGSIGSAIVLAALLISFPRIMVRVDPVTWHGILLLFGGALVLAGALLRAGPLRAEMAELSRVKSWFMTTPPVKPPAGSPPIARTMTAPTPQQHLQSRILPARRHVPDSDL